jgi:tetratricopeptide (TPR) repeat protein
MVMFSWISKLSVSDIIAFLALLVSIWAIIQTQRISAKEEMNTKERNRNIAERFLDEALDLMNSGKPGTESLFMNYQPPSTDERAYFELARRKINDAKVLAPDFYLCHHYEGVYARKIQGSDIHERALNALKFYEKAVKIWEEDKDPRTKGDGWPYHDLAGVYSDLGKDREAEKYYQKAIGVNSTTEPYFYRDFALFLLDRGRESEYRKYMDKANKIAQATGKPCPPKQ